MDSKVIPNWTAETIKFALKKVPTNNNKISEVLRETYYNLLLTT
jgi:hypothetical protein